MSKNLFITGTGTDIGKTYVSGLIVKKLQECGKKPAYYKAAMSGNKRGKNGMLIPGDAEHVKRISAIDQPIETMCPYVYENAVSPHLASRIEGNPVCMDVIKETFSNLCSNYEYITVEGSGGIICPISFDKEKIQLENVVKELNLPSIIVADAGLGTINNVVLTAKYIDAKGLSLKGIIFNNFHVKNLMEEDNIVMCEKLTGLKVLACIKPGDTSIDISEEKLVALYE